MEKRRYVKDLSLDERKDIVARYEVLETAISIGKLYNIPRLSIIALLKRRGVDTSKRKIKIKCTFCGKDLYRHKQRLRNSKHLFCDYHCYYSWLEAGNGAGKYKANRIGQQIARAKVFAEFELKQGHIVHHQDRNCLNNDMDNLKVFACQGDHVRYHRGFDIEPVWVAKL